MNYAAVKKTDVANGPGVRVSLFVSGCTHGCKGCFNAEAWDFGYGQAYTRETEDEILEALSKPYIRGLSVLGGEPMEPSNRGTVLGLLRKVRQRFPGKDIWCYTGYDYEKDLLRWAAEERRCRGAECAASADRADGAESAGGVRECAEAAGSADVAELSGGVPECAEAAGGADGAAQTGGVLERVAQPAGEMWELLSLIDVLVDGEFVEERKNLRLAFRGSENQRLIDVRESLRQGRVVCLP